MAFTAKTKDFNSKKGNAYKFQTVMNSVQAQIWDNGTNDAGVTLNAKMMPLLLEHIVVQPSGLTMDDFDTWDELVEVTNAAASFLRTGE